MIRLLLAMMLAAFLTAPAHALTVDSVYYDRTDGAPRFSPITLTYGVDHPSLDEPKRQLDRALDMIVTAAAPWANFRFDVLGWTWAQADAARDRHPRQFQATFDGSAALFNALGMVEGTRRRPFDTHVLAYVNKIDCERCVGRAGGGYATVERAWARRDEGQLIAHELLHSLGIRAHSSAPDNILNAIFFRLGDTLTEGQVDILTRSPSVAFDGSTYSAQVLPFWLTTAPLPENATVSLPETSPTPVPLPAAGFLLAAALIAACVRLR